MCLYFTQLACVQPLALLKKNWREERRGELATVVTGSSSKQVLDIKKDVYLVALIVFCSLWVY